MSNKTPTNSAMTETDIVDRIVAYGESLGLKNPEVEITPIDIGVEELYCQCDKDDENVKFVKGNVTTPLDEPLSSRLLEEGYRYMDTLQAILGVRH